jgi:signal transduction histidine kinase
MAVERDRERLANDVHDQLGSNMSSIKIYFQGIKKLVDSNNEKLQSNLSKIDSAIERSTGEIRKISKNIVSGILAEFGLPAAIQDLADTIRQGGYECNLDIQTFEHRFSRDIEINLFRIAQELSTNSIRHSGGSVIEIGLKHDKGKLVLTYRDNGVGYEKSAVNKGMGLNNLLSRSEQIDGFFSDDTEKDIGVSYLFSIPLDKNQSK